MAILSASTRPAKAGAAGWFAWKAESSFGWAGGVVLVLFFAVASYTLQYHEKWDDEAQAWLIARDNSVWQILRTRLHYEGAPPTWHLLLHFFHALGGTYTGIGWLSVVLATGGMYVWLRWSPFPKLLRYLLPFTFFFLYQYAVIARSYVLVPLLMFALCALFTRRRKILWFALIAGILANVSLQGFVLALVMCALYGYEIYRTRKRNQPPVPARAQVATAVFCCLACVAVYCAIPAPDLDFAIGAQVSDGLVHRILLTIIGETPRNVPRPQPEAPINIPVQARPAANLHAEPRAWVAELIYPRFPHDDHRFIRSAFQNVGPPMLEFVDQASWSLATSTLLAFTFLVVAVCWLRARRRLRMLLPWLALIATGQLLWTAEHHAGMLLVALLAGLWLACSTTPDAHVSPRLECGLGVLLAVVLSGQIAWSAASIRAEVQGSYDPGPETAQWLKVQDKPRMAGFGFPTVSIQPWYPRSPFFNVPTSWWQWSSNVEVDGIHNDTLATHPDVVVYGIEFPGNGMMRDQTLPLTHIDSDEEKNLPHDLLVRDLHVHGYVETHRFCGHRFARLRDAYRVCDLVFEPAP